MRGITLGLWLRRRFTGRGRLKIALFAALLILMTLLFLFPSVAPRYLFTLGERFSFLTPQGFTLGQLYDFSSPVFSSNSTRTQDSSKVNELVLPRSDNKAIVFKYPQAVTLGRPTYLSNDITQSVDFTVKEPPATGLVQIWVLNTTMEEFLETSKSSSTLQYLTFSSRREKENALSIVLWDYTFTNEERTIRGLEAFFDDKPYMYRLSVFLDDSNYNEAFQTLFNNMVKSVKVK